METIKNLKTLESELSTNINLQQEFREDPVGTMKNITKNLPIEPLKDLWIYRVVVFSLGLTVLSIVIGVLVLMGMNIITDDGKIPTILTALGSAAIGAIAGLLAPSPERKIE